MFLKLNENLWALVADALWKAIFWICSVSTEVLTKYYIDYFMESARVRYFRSSFWYKNNECVNTVPSTFHSLRLSASTLSLLQKPIVISPRFMISCVWFVSLALLFLKSFALSFQTFPCLVKLFVVDNAYGIFAFFKAIVASSFCLRNSPSKLTLNV